MSPGPAEGPVAGAAELALLLARYGIGDPEQVGAVRAAYDVVCTTSAALLVDAAIDLLDDLRHDVETDPRVVVVFLGRDGLVLGSAIENLDPDFAAAHTRSVVLSRVIVEQALRDLETATARRLDVPPAFRLTWTDVELDAPGAYRSLTRYLNDAGVPVGETGSRVVLVDTSYKGTVQEMLAAAYPQTEFRGRYLIHGAHPDDPHPHTKQGYLVHRVPDPAGGYPTANLPPEQALTFTAQEAVAAIEDLHHGPYGSARRWRDDEPAPEGGAGDTELDQINPARLPDRYTDPAVRDAVLEAAALAVADTARITAAALAAETARAPQQPEGAARTQPAPRARLAEQAEQFTLAVRAWIERRDPSAAERGLDPRLAELLDGFVHRLDRSAVQELTTTAAQYRTDPRELSGYYIDLARAGSSAERQAVLDRAQHNILSLDPADQPTLDTADPGDHGRPESQPSPTTPSATTLGRERTTSDGPEAESTPATQHPSLDHRGPSGTEPGSSTPSQMSRSQADRTARSLVDLDQEMIRDDEFTPVRPPAQPFTAPQLQPRNEPNPGPEAEPGA